MTLGEMVQEYRDCAFGSVDVKKLRIAALSRELGYLLHRSYRSDRYT
jgi:hypothetical protein